MDVETAAAVDDEDSSVEILQVSDGTLLCDIENIPDHFWDPVVAYPAAESDEEYVSKVHSTPATTEKSDLDKKFSVSSAQPVTQPPQTVPVSTSASNSVADSVPTAAVSGSTVKNKRQKKSKDAPAVSATPTEEGSGVSDEETIVGGDDYFPEASLLFRNYDRSFFCDTLTGRVDLEWSRRMTLCAGICYYKKTPTQRQVLQASKDGTVETLLTRFPRCVIRLSEPLLSLRPIIDLKQTLAHEMIHAYCFLFGLEKSRDGHGQVFQTYMHAINRATDLNITVYHNFGEEVRHLQKHVWRCTGPCRLLPPYFGYVRRANNHPPGPSSWWWERHQLTCGGSYIRESETPVSKKNATKKKADPKVTKSITIDRFLMPSPQQSPQASAEVSVETSPQISPPSELYVIDEGVADLGVCICAGGPDEMGDYIPPPPPSIPSADHVCQCPRPALAPPPPMPPTESETLMSFRKRITPKRKALPKHTFPETTTGQVTVRAQGRAQGHAASPSITMAEVPDTMALSVHLSGGNDTSVTEGTGQGISINLTTPEAEPQGPPTEFTPSGPTAKVATLHQRLQAMRRIA